jgi:hypothetical protein
MKDLLTKPYNKYSFNNARLRLAKWGFKSSQANQKEATQEVKRLIEELGG